MTNTTDNAPEFVVLAGTEYRRADLPPTDAEVMAHPKVRVLVDVANETVRLLWEEMGKQGNAGTHGGYIYMKLRAALAAIQEDRG